MFLFDVHTSQVARFCIHGATAIESADNYFPFYLEFTIRKFKLTAVVFPQGQLFFTDSARNNPDRHKLVGTRSVGNRLKKIEASFCR